MQDLTIIQVDSSDFRLPFPILGQSLVLHTVLNHNSALRYTRQIKDSTENVLPFVLLQLEREGFYAWSFLTVIDIRWPIYSKQKQRYLPVFVVCCLQTGLLQQAIWLWRYSAPCSLGLPGQRGSSLVDARRKLVVARYHPWNALILVEIFWQYLDHKRRPHFHTDDACIYNFRMFQEYAF